MVNKSHTFAGDLIVSQNIVDQNWLFGHILSNSDKKGIFPLTHVTQVYTYVHKDEEKPTQNIFRQAKAIHAFDYTHLVNEEQKYLKLNVGDYILVTGELKDPNWLQGEDSSGEKGIFPANYIEYIQGNILTQHIFINK